MVDIYRFENFVVGPSNAFAYEASKTVAKHPGVYNPLIIYSNNLSGVGKTFLGKSIEWECKKTSSTLYITNEELAYQIIEGIRHGSTEMVRDKFACYDLLIIDGLEYLRERPAMTIEIMRLVKRIVCIEEKQVVLITSEPPEENVFEKCLKRDCEKMLQAEILQPDYKTRKNILKKKYGGSLALDDRVVDYIAVNVQSIWLLLGCYNRVRAFEVLHGRKIKLNEAKVLLKDSIPCLTMEDIVLGVAAYFVIDIDEIMQPNNNMERKISIYLLRKNTKAKLLEIGNYMGTDVTSVIIAINTIERFNHNREFMNELGKIEDKIIEVKYGT